MFSKQDTDCRSIGDCKKELAKSTSPKSFLHIAVAISYSYVEVYFHPSNWEG